MKAAQELLADKDNAMAEEIETAENNLLNAMLNLRYKADKSILEKVIAEANEVDASAYTAESYAALQAAVAEANDSNGRRKRNPGRSRCSSNKRTSSNGSVW